MLGIGVHMVLASMLGVVLVFAWQSMRATLRREPLSVHARGSRRRVGDQLLRGAADCQPAFIHMVPYAIGLTSKLLFGVAAVEVVRDEAIFAAPAASRER